MISPRQAFRNFFGRPGVLYAVLGALAGVVLIVAIGSLSSMIIRDSIERDLDVGAKTIYRSMRDRASVSGVGDEAALSATMDGIADNESILGLGFCTSDDRLAIATPGLPLTLHCKTFARQNGEGANLTTAKGDRIRVNSFPLTVGAAHGRLLVADDLDVAERRERHVQIYVTAALAALATGFVVLTAAVFLALRRSWMQSLRGALEASQRPPEPETNGQPGADRRIGAIFADLLVRRGFAQAFHVKWTPESLRQLLRDELPGAQVIIVSNREPYIHNRIDGEISLQIPASGLVSALEPVMRACSGVWIAHGGGSADRETVDDARPADGSARTPRLCVCGASGSPRRSRTAIISASPTRACGRSAISPLSARLSASRTGPASGRSTCALPRRWSRRRPARIRSSWSRIIISRCCRA